MLGCAQQTRWKEWAPVFLVFFFKCDRERLYLFKWLNSNELTVQQKMCSVWTAWGWKGRNKHAPHASFSSSSCLLVWKWSIFRGIFTPMCHLFQKENNTCMHNVCIGCHRHSIIYHPYYTWNITNAQSSYIFMMFSCVFPSNSLLSWHSYLFILCNHFAAGTGMLYFSYLGAALCCWDHIVSPPSEFKHLLGCVKT